MKKALITITALTIVCQIWAQQKPEIVSYVNQYRDVAIEEMVRTNIPASITLAQGILESGCGLSDLSKKANNHFGIKCKDEWTGARFYQNDDAPNECFRVYANARESYADHSDFLVNRSRYAELFKLPAGDYKSWAHGLKAAGYATNPKYAPILINYVEQYSLHEYDKIGYAILKARENDPNINNSTTASTTKTEQAVRVTENIDIHSPEIKATRKEFLANGVRAIKATANEAPFTIALEYNIDYYHILSFNDLTDGEKFKEGENIFLQPKRNKAEQNHHQVKRGQSMRDIAQLHGMKLKDLYYKNQMKANDQPLAGEKLNLRDKRNSAPKTMTYAAYLKAQGNVQQAVVKTTTANTVQLNDDAYQVQPKDTLYSIARKFNTSVDKIRELNSIEGSYIKPGQTLLVSE